MSNSQQRIYEFIQNELIIHSNSRLIDLFKLYMQSVFGPGHMIKNKTLAKEFLKQELFSNITFISVFDKSSNHPYVLNMRDEHKILNDQDIECPCIFQKCDIFFPLARFSLQIIRDKIIPFDDYFEAFIMTANDNFILSDKDFLYYWNYVVQDIRSNYNIPDIDNDLESLKIQLQNKQFLFSHSKNYHISYSPSYRIINYNYLEKYIEDIQNYYFKNKLSLL